MNKNKKLAIIFLLLFSLSCAKDEIVVPKLLPNPPVGLVGYSSQNKIILSFWANNTEYGFEGYNVYVSKNSINYFVLDSVDGTSPTIRLYSFDINTKQKYVIKKLNNNEPLTNGKKYWFKITSQLYYSDGTRKESEPSNIVAVTFTTQPDVVIYNYKSRALGINFNTNTTTLTTNQGDMFFKLIGSPSALPYLTVESNSIFIQDVGYLTDWESYIPPASGYFGPDTSILAVKNHLYILHNKTKNFYIKIYLINVPSAQSSITNDVSITFKWSPWY